MLAMMNQFAMKSSFGQAATRLRSAAASVISTNGFHTTAVTRGEPTKARKRIDPQVLMLRERRKTKRIEKEIRRMERFGRKLKPIEEHEPERRVVKEAAQRKRVEAKTTATSPTKGAGAEQESDDAFFLRREWTNYINQQHNAQMEQIRLALRSQDKALKELKKDNVDLYNKAVQLDAKLIPFVREGPVFTPANKNYEPPEGDYQDVTYMYDRR